MLKPPVKGLEEVKGKMLTRT